MKPPLLHSHTSYGSSVAVPVERIKRIGLRLKNTLKGQQH